MVQGAPVSDLIRRLLLLINYEAHIKKTQHDWETRWENVEELINFASPLAILSGEKLYNVENNDQQLSTSARETTREVIDLVSNSEDDGEALSSMRYAMETKSDLPLLMKSAHQRNPFKSFSSSIDAFNGRRDKR